LSTTSASLYIPGRSGAPDGGLPHPLVVGFALLSIFVGNATHGFGLIFFHERDWAKIALKPLFL
jgi:hypothetical protein